MPCASREVQARPAGHRRPPSTAALPGHLRRGGTLERGAGDAGPRALGSAVGTELKAWNRAGRVGTVLTDDFVKYHWPVRFLVPAVRQEQLVR